MTIRVVSDQTGLPVTTIRYWEKTGLINPTRNKENNYRLYQKDDIQHILTIYAIKLSVESKGNRYSINRLKELLQGFDYNGLYGEIYKQSVAIRLHTHFTVGMASLPASKECESMPLKTCRC